MSDEEKVNKSNKKRKIFEVLAVFIIIDFIGGGLIEMSGIASIFFMLFLSVLIVLYGLYLVRKKDLYSLKIYFNIIIFLGLLKILLRVIDRL